MHPCFGYKIPGNYTQVTHPPLCPITLLVPTPLLCRRAGFKIEWIEWIVSSLLFQLFPVHPVFPPCSNTRSVLVTCPPPFFFLSVFFFLPKSGCAGGSISTITVWCQTTLQSDWSAAEQYVWILRRMTPPVIPHECWDSDLVVIMIRQRSFVYPGIWALKMSIT